MLVQEGIGCTSGMSLNQPPIESRLFLTRVCCDKVWGRKGVKRLFLKVFFSDKNFDKKFPPSARSFLFSRMNWNFARFIAFFLFLSQSGHDWDLWGTITICNNFLKTKIMWMRRFIKRQRWYCFMINQMIWKHMISIIKQHIEWWIYSHLDVLLQVHKLFQNEWLAVRFPRVESEAPSHSRWFGTGCPAPSRSLEEKEYFSQNWNTDDRFQTWSGIFGVDLSVLMHQRKDLSRRGAGPRLDIK